MNENFHPLIKEHDSSDYGHYGKTGKIEDHGLPVVKCKCGGKPILDCEYDDTPGYRETVYTIECDTCDNFAGVTCLIAQAIAEWDSKNKPKEKGKKK